MTSPKRGRGAIGTGAAARGADDDPNGEWPPPVDGRCNARLDKDKPPGQRRRCKSVAGIGTPYKVGSCAQHGGGHENGRKHAARVTYEAEYQGSVLFGEVVDMPHDLGLAHVAGKLAGLAAYIEQDLVRTAGDDGRVSLVERVPTAAGMRDAVDVRITLLRETLVDLARVHKMAIDAGVAQRQFDLVAAYQARVLDLVEAGLRAGGVDPDDPAVAAEVGRRLELVSGTGIGAA